MAQHEGQLPCPFSRAMVMAIGEDDRARRNQVAVVVAIRAGNHSCGVGDLNAALGRMVLDSNWWRSVIASIGGIRERNMQRPRAT